MRLIPHALASLFAANPDPAPKPKAAGLFDDIAVDKIMAALTRLPDPDAILKQVGYSLATGGTQAEWMKDVADGKIPLDLPAHQLDNIFRTNIQSAYNAGRARQQESSDALASRGYFMYDAVNDGRTRPAHRKLDNFIAPAGDPIWKKITPPNGHRCRCVRIALTEAQAKARGWQPGSLPPIGAGADPGWEYHPLAEEGMAGVRQAVAERMGRCRSAGFAADGKKGRLECDNEKAAEYLDSLGQTR